MMPGPAPCTPAGIEALLAFYEIPVAGQEVCILGRGTTLGRPLALLLSQKRPTANAAVTVVHTGVPDWPRYTQRAGIVIAAAGVPGHPPARAHHRGRGRRRRWRALRGTPPAPRRRRGVRGGRGRDHAARRRRRADDHRHAVPQRRRGRRATCRARTVSAEPQPHDDPRDDGRDESHRAAAPPPPPPGGVVSACPLCGAPVPATELRCPQCNMTLAGIDGRPGPVQPHRAVRVGGGARAHLPRGPRRRRAHSRLTQRRR